MVDNPPSSEKLPGIKSTLQRHWDVIKNHLTAVRILNFMQNITAWEAGSSKAFGTPSIIKFEPSIDCQLSCYCCRGGPTRDQLHGLNGARSLDFDIYQSVINEVGSTLLEASLYDEGEPMLSPKIVEMISLASKRNIGTVISTNGSFSPLSAGVRNRLLGVADAGLDKIIFGIDGLDQATYGAYRKGGNVQYALENMGLVAEHTQRNGLDMIIEWQMIKFVGDVAGGWADNSQQWTIAKKMADDMGVQFRLIPNGLAANQDFAYSRQTRCVIPYVSMSIDYQGKVGGCLVYDSPGLEMGKLDKNTSLTKIWNSLEFRKLRKSHHKPNEKALDPRLPCYRCNRFGG